MKRKCYEILGIDPTAEKCQKCPIMAHNDRDETAKECWLYASSYCSPVTGMLHCMECKVFIDNEKAHI